MCAWNLPAVEVLYAGCLFLSRVFRRDLALVDMLRHRLCQLQNLKTSKFALV